MLMLIYAGALPSPEEFKRNMAEALKVANPVDDLLELADELHSFKQQYQMSSSDFYLKYQVGVLQRRKFRYYYQHADGRLFFRCANSPHYPHLSSFLSHKHIGEDMIAAEPPDLADVLREIDAIIYSRTDERP